MRSKSDVQIGKPEYAASGKFRARTPLNGFMMNSQQQMIIEKLKLENEPLSTTYKTAAHVTFSSGIVFKGVIELDSETLCVKEDFGVEARNKFLTRR